MMLWIYTNTSMRLCRRFKNNYVFQGDAGDVVFPNWYDANNGIQIFSLHCAVGIVNEQTTVTRRQIAIYLLCANVISR